MTESTDETLSAVCQHCGKRFHRRRYVNRYTTYASEELLGKPAPAKYCSPACRKDAYRVRSRCVAGPEVTEMPARCVAATSDAPPPPQPAFPGRSTADDQSAFERLRGDRVLSNWKPSLTDVDCEPIPGFLRRKPVEAPVASKSREDGVSAPDVTVEPVVAGELPAPPRPAFRRPYG